MSRLLLQLLLFASLLITGELAVVQAADCIGVALKEIPNCAQTCFINGALSIGCGSIDFACQCEQEAKLYAAIEGCVATGCPSASFQAVIDGASSVCNCATVGLAGSVGSMTVSGIGGSQMVVPGTVVPSSFTTTVPATTSTTRASVSSSSNPLTTAAPTLTTPLATQTPFATASVVHSGSARSSMVDLRIIASVVGAVALGFAWL